MLIEDLIAVIDDMARVSNEYALGLRPHVRLGDGLWSQLVDWMDSMLMFKPDHYHPGGAEVRIADTVWRRDLRLPFDSWAVDMEVPA